MIIDAEVRIWPRTFSPRMREAISNEDIVHRKIIDHPLGTKAMDLAEPERIRRSISGAGIGHALIRGVFWKNPDLCMEHTAELVGISRESPDLFTPVAVMPAPTATDPLETIKHYHRDLGLRIVEFIPSWQGYAIDDRRVFPALEYAEKENLIVAIETDHFFRDPATIDTVSSAFKVFREFPRLSVLLPHLGGGFFLYYFNEDLVRCFDNLYFVTSVPKTPQWIKIASEILPEDRVVFGTDHPFNFDLSQENLMRAVRELPIGEARRSKILGGTVKRLLNDRGLGPVQANEAFKSPNPGTPC